MANREMTMVYSIAGKIASSFGSSTGNAQKKLAGLRQTASDLQRAMRSTEQAQRLLDQSFAAGGMSAETYRQRMQEMKKAMDGYNRALGENARAQQEAIANGGAGLASRGADLGGKFTGLLAVVGKIGAISAPFAAAVKSSMTFEAALSKVQAVTGATADDMAKLKEQASELGATTQFSASQAADAMTYLGMAGWKTEQIMAGMPGLLDLAAASGTDLATTADIVSDDLTAFGMKAEQAGHMADVMAAASSNANTNVEMMGMTFKYAGAVAGALGYSLEDVTVATGLMANAGIKGEQAGTSLRAIMNRLVAPPASAARAMEQLGISVTNADGSMKPFNQTMQDLRARFAGLSEAEKAELASSIAGTEAMSGFLAIINASDDDFNKMTNAVNNADGAAKKMADTMQDNLQGDMTKLKSAVEAVANAIGGALTPMLRNVAQQVLEVVSAFAEWAEAHKDLLATLGQIAGAIAATIIGVKAFSLGFTALMMVVGQVKTAFVALKTVFTAITTAFQVGRMILSAFAVGAKLAAAGQAILNAVMAANPIGLVVVAIAGLVAALVYLYNTNETVRNALNAAWEFLKANLGSILAAIAGFIVGGPIGALGALLAANENLRSAMVNIWNTICTTVSNAVDSISQKWDNLREKLSHPIDSAISLVTGGGSVEHNAKGGIYGKGAFLTTFAENSPEAAIPLDGSRRAENLWRQTGSMMGLTGSNMSVNLSIPVTVNGNADSGTIARIQQGIDDAVERALARIQHQRGRVSYA